MPGFTFGYITGKANSWGSVVGLILAVLILELYDKIKKRYYKRNK